MCSCTCTCVCLQSVVVDCGVLLGPPDGVVNLSNGTTFGSMATYSCNSGYRLDGNTTRICLSSGEWSDNEPICQCKWTIRKNDIIDLCVCVCVCSCVCVCNYSG